MENTEKRFELKAWKVLIGLNVLVFALGYLLDITLTNDLIFIHGAKVNFRIADGHIYRLISSMFIHADLFHLLANCYAIYVLGDVIEKFFGTKKFLIIFFVAGITGSLASFIFSPHNSVGASGGIFGFFGVHLYLYLRKPDVYKKIFGTSIFVLLAINIFIGITSDRIDNFAHLGGLVGGMAACFAVGLKFENMFDSKRTLAQVLIIGTLAVSLFFGMQYRSETPDYYFQKAYYSFVDMNNEAGTELLIAGIQKHPNDPDIISLISWVNENYRVIYDLNKSK